MKTIKEDGTAQIIEKKSKFISNLFYVTSIEEAENKLLQIRKKYHDAKHHCYAYRICKQNDIIEKSSDDGEPSGTAGAPMLNILQKEELTNVLAVVTRYFGGILLGTGGLVKAYTESTKKAIENTTITIEEAGVLAEIILDYKNFENFKYCCKKSNANIVDIKYSDNIICKIEIAETEKEKLFEYMQENNINLIKIQLLENKNIRKNIDIYD